MKAFIIYTLTWFLILAAAGVVNSTGNSNEMVERVFGLTFVMLFFAGAVIGFPFSINEYFSPKTQAK